MVVIDPEEVRVRDNVKMLCQFIYYNFADIDQRMTFLEEVGLVSTSSKYSESKKIVKSNLTFEMEEVVKCIKAALTSLAGVAAILSILDTISSAKIALELGDKLNASEMAEVDLTFSKDDQMVFAMVKVSKVQSLKSFFTTAAKHKYRLEYCVYRVQVSKFFLRSTLAVKMAALQRYESFRSLSITDRMIAHLKLREDIHALTREDNLLTKVEKAEDVDE